MSAGAILRVPAERRLLAEIRDFVELHAQSVDAAPHDIDDLIQAVDEASTNVIVHGYQDGPGMIEVEVINLPGKIIVYLRDRAPTFDPTKVPAPNLSLPLERRPVGGLGVHLIRQCVDDFRHCVPEGGGNEVVLVKRIKKDD